MFVRDSSETIGTQPAGHATASQATVLPSARAMPIPALAPRSRATAVSTTQQQLAQQPVVVLNQSPQQAQQQPPGAGTAQPGQFARRPQLPFPQLAPRQPATATAQTSQQPKVPAQAAHAKPTPARPSAAPAAVAHAVPQSAAAASANSNALNAGDLLALLPSLQAMAAAQYQAMNTAITVASSPNLNAFMLNNEALKVFSGCVVTSHKGVILRKEDNKYLATLPVPPASPEQRQGVWVALKAWDTPEEAAAMYDCVALAYYGSRANTNQPASSYTLERVVRSMVMARSQGTFQATHIQLLALVNSISMAKAAGVPCSPQVERAAEEILCQHLCEKPAELLEVLGKQPGTSAAVAAAVAAAAGPAQPPPGQPAPTPAAGQASGSGSQPARTGTPGVPSGTTMPHPVLAAFKGRAGAATTVAQQQRSATPPAVTVKQEGSQGTGQPTAAPGSLMTAAGLAANKAGVQKPGSPAPTGGGSPFSKLQQQPQQQPGNLVARAMLMAARPGAATGPAAGTSGQTSLGNSNMKPGTMAPGARPTTPTNAGSDALVKKEIKREALKRPASAGPVQAGTQVKAAQTPTIVQQQMLNMITAVAAGKVPPGMAGANLEQLLHNMQRQVQQQVQKAAAPNGVTQLPSGPNKGKWEVRTRYYTPKGELSMQVLGHFNTRDEAITIHDCAALAVPNSQRYLPAHKYTMKQVLTLVFSMCHKPGYDLEGIVRDAQLNALKYGLKPLLEEHMGQQTTPSSDQDAKPPPAPPSATAAKEAPRPSITPPSAPAGLSMPSVPTVLTQTSGQLVKLLVQVVKDASGGERVRAHILVLPNLNTARAAASPMLRAGAAARGANPAPAVNQPAAAAAAASTTTAGAAAAALPGPSRPGTPVPPRFRLKYAPIARQDLAGVQGSLAAGIIQAQRYVGVHAEQDQDSTTIKFSVQLQHTPGTVFSLRSFNSPVDAARVHDLIALGVFGKSAVHALNDKPHKYTYHEVLQATQVLAKQYDLVRLLHLPHVLECAAEAGVDCKGALGAAGVTVPAAPKPDGRKRKADADGEVTGREKIGKVAAGQLAQPTQYTGVWQEVAGVNAGKFSAKQCGPTGQQRTPNIYLVVGYFETAEAAARARDRAAIALQSAPRLNFPGETHTRAQIMAAVSPMIESNRRSLAKDVAKIIESNIARYEKKLATAAVPAAALACKTTTLSIVKLMVQPCERLSLDIKPVSETSMTDADLVTVTLSLYEGVSVTLAVVETVVPSLNGPGSPISSRVALTKSLAAKPGSTLGPGRPAGSPMARQAAGAGGGPTGPRVGHKREARVAKEAQEILQRSQRRKPVHMPVPDKEVGGVAAMEVDAVPTPPSSVLAAPGPENSEQDNDRVTSAAEVASMSAAESMDVDDMDVELATANRQQSSKAEEEMAMAVEREYWEAQRAAKRSRGVLPSALPPEGEFLGVMEDPLPGNSQVMWAGKASLTNKEGRPAYLVVGRYDDPEMAARVRDLGALAVGNATVPRLNFDADEYQLSEVELLLGSLAEEYPQHFTLDMLIPALKSAAKHGVKDDLPADHPFHTGQKPDKRRRVGSVQTTGRNTPPPRDNLRSGALPSRQSLVDITRQDSLAEIADDSQPALSRQGSVMLPVVGAQRKPSLPSTISGSSLGGKRPRSPDYVSPEAMAAGQPVVAPDYVCVVLRVVPRLRVTLVPDPAPCARRPLVRMYVQESAGIQLDMGVGAAPEGWLPPSEDLPHAKRARHSHMPDVDMLLILADVAMQDFQDEALIADSDDYALGGANNSLVAAGRGLKRGADGKARGLPGSASSPEHHAQVALRVASLPQLLDPYTEFDDQVQTAEAILMKLRRENVAALRQAMQNLDQANGGSPWLRLGQSADTLGRGVADGPGGGQLARYGNGAGRGQGQALRQGGRGGAAIIPAARATRGGRGGANGANVGNRRVPPTLAAVLNGVAVQQRPGVQQQPRAKHFETVALDLSASSASSDSSSSTSDEEEVPSSSSSSSSDDDEEVPLAKRARAARGGGQAGRGGRGAGRGGAGAGMTLIPTATAGRGGGAQVGLHLQHSSSPRPGGVPGGVPGAGIGLNLGSRPQQPQLPQIPHSSLANHTQQQKLQQLQQLHRAGQQKAAQMQAVAAAARRDSVLGQHGSAASRKPAAIGLNLNPAVQQPGQMATPPGNAMTAASGSRPQTTPSAFRSSVATSVAKMVGLSQAINAGASTPPPAGLTAAGESTSREGSGVGAGLVGGAGQAQAAGPKRGLSLTRDASYHEQLARHVQNRVGPAPAAPVQAGATRTSSAPGGNSQTPPAGAAAGVGGRAPGAPQEPRMVLVPAGAAWGSTPMMMPYPGSMIMPTGEAAGASGSFQYRAPHGGPVYTTNPSTNTQVDAKP